MFLAYLFLSKLFLSIACFLVQPYKLRPRRYTYPLRNVTILHESHLLRVILNLGGKLGNLENS